MSNRTDYGSLAQEIAEMYGLSCAALERVEAELHNAHVAGQEGSACACSSCEPALTSIYEAAGIERANPTLSRMILCPECGNKRCPRATHHDNACTRSNAPGQVGSNYE